MAKNKERIPNNLLRRIRELERHETRDEFAQAVADAADVPVGCDARLVARWEDGEIRAPRATYRRALERVTGRPFRELGFSRPSRPSQASQISAENPHLPQMSPAETAGLPPFGPMMEASTQLTPPSTATAGGGGTVEGHGADSDSVYIACRAPDGRIIWMPLPRRTFLLNGLGATAAVVGGTAPTATAASGPALTVQPVRSAATTLTPEHVAHFRQTLKVLDGEDNLFGPGRVIGAARQHFTNVEHIRRTWPGSVTQRRELLEIQTEFANLCSWLYQDAGSHGPAGYWMDRALELANMAGDNEVVAWMLGCKSHLLIEMRRPAEALDIAEAATRLARPGGRTAVVATIRTAHAHAFMGAATESQRAHERAREQYARLDCDPAFPYGEFLYDGNLDVQEAYSLTTLGEHGAAAKLYAQTVRKVPASYHRDQGVHLARQALTHARGEEPERAATVGTKALGIAAATGSARIAIELRQLSGMLSQWVALADVRDFQTNLRERLPA